VFRNLELPDYEMIPIKWLTPRAGEHLKEYVKRLLPQIKTDTEPILMGLSFGGIVAIEISKLIKTHKVIIISSIKTYHERPVKMSLLYLMKFYRIGMRTSRPRDAPTLSMTSTPVSMMPNRATSCAETPQAANESVVVAINLSRRVIVQGSSCSIDGVGVAEPR
jgi:esterase/lipase